MKSLLLVLTLLLAPLAFATDASDQATAIAKPPHVSTAADYSAAVSNSARSDKDRERDLREHPADIFALAGIKPGMAVADVFGAGGYWSELLTYVVGPKGSVLLVNNPPYEEFAKKDLGTRFTGNRLASVKRLVVDPADMKLGTATLDAAIIVMSYHDLYYVDEKGGWPAVDPRKFLDQIHAALKPKAAFIIVDHSAKAGTGSAAAQELHRIDEEFTKKDLASHGFRLEKTWDGLRNPADDRSKIVFDPAIRGKTDRFVHVYRRI